MLDQLQMHAIQINYVNRDMHSGIVNEYLKEARRERISKDKMRVEAVKIVDQWMTRFDKPTNSVILEEKKIKARIFDVTLEELSAFISTFYKGGFNRAINKLFED